MNTNYVPLNYWLPEEDVWVSDDTGKVLQRKMGGCSEDNGYGVGSGSGSGVGSGSGALPPLVG